MTNPLKDDFASFAEHAVAPDMHAKVLARSRGLGIRRAVAGAAAALVVLAGGVTAAFAVADQLPGKGSEAAGGLDGTFYYVDRGGAQGRTRVLSWTPGQDAPTVVLEGDDTLRSTATVSPDGSRIAWREPTGDGLTATLMMKDLASGEVTTLMDAFRYLPCAEPAWSPDSKSLLVGRFPLQEGAGVSASYVDIDEPQVFGEAVDVPGCHPRIVAEGGSAGAIYYVGDMGVEVSAPNSAGPSADLSQVADNVLQVVGRPISNIVSVNADASKVCLSTDMQSVDRVLTCDTVVELTGGQVFLTSPEFSASYLFAGDAVIERANGVLTVIDGSLTELGSIGEPPLGPDAELLSYDG